MTIRLPGQHHRQIPNDGSSCMRFRASRWRKLRWQGQECFIRWCNQRDAIGPHKGDNLTQAQIEENTTVVHRAWKLFSDIPHILFGNGFYQGWDPNPAQLPMRYAAVYTFFLESYEDAAARLFHFCKQSSTKQHFQATSSTMLQQDKDCLTTFFAGNEFRSHLRRRSISNRTHSGWNSQQIFLPDIEGRRA